MIKKDYYWVFVGGLGLLVSLLLVSPCLANSDYVLPYPGLMPGHRFYPFEQIIDKLYRFWAFGNFAGYKYELKLADKKLVEAKTLFEYDQHLLAIQALEESNHHFEKAAFYLYEAKKEGRDVSQKMAIFQSAAARHREVLEKLKEALPEKFLWRPEKKETIQLEIRQQIERAVKFREF